MKVRIHKLYMLLPKFSTTFTQMFTKIKIVSTLFVYFKNLLNLTYSHLSDDLPHDTINL